MKHFLVDDGLNESQPIGSIPDFDPEESLDFPAFEDAAADAEAIFTGVTEAERPARARTRSDLPH